MSLKQISTIAIILVLLTACTGTKIPAENNAPVNTQNQPAKLTATNAEVLPTGTLAADSTLPPAPSLTEVPETNTSATPAVGAWVNMPVIPELSPAMKAVYARGLTDGHDPHRFSKIGDCQNINTYFLAMFDSGSYRLGTDYAYLQPTIDYFSGSWSRKSLAVKGGLNVIAVQNPMWTQIVEKYVNKPGTCKKGETPLVCELRENNPSFALISMEESWDGSLSIYDQNLRSIVKYVLSLDIVPILATRSELLTQDRQINDMVVKVAKDYDLPLWNFGAAAAKLPNAGLMNDGVGFHLTRMEGQSQAMFDDPKMMQLGFTWRNLTALQTLDAIRKDVGAQP